MIVVFDTPPILNLARIDRLELLANLDQQVLIPPVVHHELLCARHEGHTSIFEELHRALESWLVLARPRTSSSLLKLYNHVLITAGGRIDPYSR